MDYDQFDDDVYIGGDGYRDVGTQLFNTQVFPLHMPLGLGFGKPRHPTLTHSHPHQVRQTLEQLSLQHSGCIVNALEATARLVPAEQQLLNLTDADARALLRRVTQHLQSSDRRVATAAASTLRPLLASRVGRSLVLYPDVKTHTQPVARDGVQR
jgi:glutamine phosphoribosylpyrophosphate amidotransferase